MFWGLTVSQKRSTARLCRTPSRKYRRSNGWGEDVVVGAFRQQCDVSGGSLSSDSLRYAPIRTCWWGSLSFLLVGGQCVGEESFLRN